MLLLIWEEVPETTKYYQFDIDSPIARLALRCAGAFVNSVATPDDHPVHELSEMLNQSHGSDDISKPIQGPFATVVICGFIM